jgi:hypothetical protein
VQSELTKSFDGAEDIAHQYPQYSQQILAAAKQSFVHGQDWAYAAGIIAVVLGAALVFLAFPKAQDEKRLLAAYHATDTGSPAREEAPPAAIPPPRATAEHPTPSDAGAPTRTEDG